MGYQISAIALAPILFLQGKFVRKTTPQLPEAKGERKGIKGNGRNCLKLMVLGDSAAAGVGVDTQANALSGQILKNLSSEFTVNWELIAYTGATTCKTIEHLKELPVTSFDVVVTSLGVNDITSGASVKTWIDGQKRLIKLLKEKFSSTFNILSAVPPMHLFPTLPQPLRWYLGTQAKRFNRELKAYTETLSDCNFLKMDLDNDPSLMATDGFHPGPELQKLWGKYIADIVNDRLA